MVWPAGRMRAERVLRLVCLLAMGCPSTPHSVDSLGLAANVAATAADPEALCLVFKDDRLPAKHILLLELQLPVQAGSNASVRAKADVELAEVNARKHAVDEDIKALEQQIQGLHRALADTQQEKTELSARAEKLSAMISGPNKVADTQEGVTEARQEMNSVAVDERMPYRVHIVHEHRILLSTVQSVEDAGMFHGLFKFSDLHISQLRVVWSRMDGLSRVSRMADCRPDDLVNRHPGGNHAATLPSPCPSFSIEVLGPLGKNLDTTVAPATFPLEIVLHPADGLSGSEIVMFSVNGALLDNIPVRTRHEWPGGAIWPDTLLDFCHDATPCIVADFMDRRLW